MCQTSSSAHTYNNTLAHNGTNIRLRIRHATLIMAIAAGITWIARDNVFKNNILSNATNLKVFDASNCGTNEPSALMISYSGYNAYYRTSSSMPT